MIEGALGGIPIGDRHPVRLMAILNASPESFYAGSIATTAVEIARLAESAASDGAAFIDVGAMSTAPYLETTIEPDQEARRLEAAVAAVRRATDLPISVDTQRALPARAALGAGATIVNDVAGLADDPALSAVVKCADVDLILVARDLAPAESSPLGRLRRALARATAAGIDLDRVTLDPGIGFTGSRTLAAQTAWNLRTLARLRDLRRLGRPLLVGISRKRFVGSLLDRSDPADRLHGSLAATAVAVLNGAHVIRTHDIAATRDAVRVAQAIRNAKTGC